MPPVVHLASGTDAPSQLAQLAATIVSMNCEKYTHIVEQMTGDSVSVDLTEKFLRFLLEKADIEQLIVHQTMLIQVIIVLTHPSLLICTMLVQRNVKTFNNIKCF